MSSGIARAIPTPNFAPYPNPTTSANGTFAQFTVPGTTGASPQG